MNQSSIKQNPAKQPPPKPRTPRTGRPTAEQSRLLDEQVVGAALRLFLEHGYDGVSMESVAQAASISKRTLYARYSDKDALFLEALRWSMKDWVFSHPDAIDLTRETLESALTKAADALLQQALHPTYVKLGRIAAAKASRFPSEAPYDFDMSLSPRVRAVTDILRAFRHELDDTSATNLEMIAELFVSLISGIPARLASFGTFREPDHEQQRLHLAVRLFTKAIRAPH